MTPLTPLDILREEMAYNPLHFWQFQGGVGTAKVTTHEQGGTSKCRPLLYEHAWQTSDASGRTELRQALEDAEQRLGQFLGYDIAPRFREETLPFPRYYDSRYDRYGFSGSDARWLPLVLPHGKVIAGGVEAHTALDAAAAVTYSDADGDGVLDTATIGPIATGGVTDPDEIAIYVPVDDRVGSTARSERWRIAPVRAAISGGSVTITAPIWLFAKPVLYGGFNPSGIDVSDGAKRLATVEVTRRFCNPAGTTQETAQAVLIYETRPWPWFCTAPTIANAQDPAGVGYALARLGIRDAEAGVVSVGEAVYDATTSQWVAPGCCGGLVRPPDRVLVRYAAGESLEDGALASYWRPIVARLAAAELARKPCACDSANRWLYEWQTDLSRTTGEGGITYAVTGQQLNNPFGFRRGHLFAYSQVQHLRQLGGLLAH